MSYFFGAGGRKPMDCLHFHKELTLLEGLIRVRKELRDMINEGDPKLMVDGICDLLRQCCSESSIDELRYRLRTQQNENPHNYVWPLTVLGHLERIAFINKWIDELVNHQTHGK